MNILIVAKDYPPKVGGVENYSQNLAEGLKEHHHCQVLTFAAKNSPISKSDGINVKRIHPIIESEIVKSIQLSLMILWVLMTSKINVICATTWKVATPTLLLKYFFKFRLFITVHGAEITRHQDSRLAMKVMNRVLNSAYRIISVSEFTKKMTLEYCTKLKASNIHVVANGIHFENLKPISSNIARQKLKLPQNGPILLTISRIDNRKGQGIIIEAIPELLKAHPSLKYVIVGDGPLRSSLQEKVKQLNIVDHVIFTGFVDFAELDLYYSACDIFVLLNTMKSDKDFEGFGLVFAEAAYYKKPSIAGNNGGPKEVIENGVTGYLIEPNTKNFIELFKKIDIRPENLTNIGEFAYQRTIDRYDIKKMIRITNSIIIQ
ncbi:MAG: glycosyltransferase family 4 protein [Reichenbachiella sp.]|uniref:glycosyltransferase family 4 protein n=1 Tax=Reichenbachiella sp. TaxID=2184521 RepID=UPI00329706CC